METFNLQGQVDLTLPAIPLRVSLTCSLSHTPHIVPLLAVSPSGPLLFCLPPDSHLDTIFHLNSMHLMISLCVSITGPQCTQIFGPTLSCVCL